MEFGRESTLVCFLACTAGTKTAGGGGGGGRRGIKVRTRKGNGVLAIPSHILFPFSLPHDPLLFNGQNKD